ncbi:helix-turn-helix transcriptional regulator [Fundidesulfovibrio terrae]|uniref:helix-turn-helix transcriptional regulator n=1 Tax=Fundidesulfovibrio terrae TaxID=2922866 RepID=UPI001FAF8101|nr:helix-turn-helix transcriptional regulator [Fundidesulfovibrio terrae]
MQRHALGQFVRAHRERLSPAAAGLPVGQRRRTPGLRREEVAQLCGVSTTWYTWIEQGRDVSISPQALGRLAMAFGLSRAERAYLFEMAGKRDPEGGEIPGPAALPHALFGVVAAIAAPAYLLDATWTVRAWNPPASRLFAGWLDRDADRNLLRYIFLDPAARSLINGWQERARRVVAELRADYGTKSNDPDMRGLIEDLGSRSALFARLWEEQAVLGREGGERTFNHPGDGFLRYSQSTFILAARPDLKLVVLTKAGESAAADPSLGEPS